MKTQPPAGFVAVVILVSLVLMGISLVFGKKEIICVHPHAGGSLVCGTPENSPFQARE